MASAHTLPLALSKCLSAGFFTVDDPGASGTISIERGKGVEVICEVVTATAESRALPATTGLPVGQRLFITLKTDGGDLTITGAVGGSVILDDAGEVAVFFISDAAGTKGWQRLVSVVSASGSSFDANGEADAFILDADGDTTISSPTDDQIDFEISGADDFTMTANTFNVLSGSSILVATGGLIDLNGIADALVLDADADTSISAPTDDQIDVEVGGADVLTITAVLMSLANTLGLKLPITDTDFETEGAIWYDASENKLKFWNGSAAEAVTSA